MNNVWSLRLLRLGKTERPSGWGGFPLPGRGGGGTRRKRGKTCGVPGPPLPAPRPGAARPAERGSPLAARLPPPAVPLRSLPMPGRHGGPLGPHPPGVLRTQRRGAGAGRLLMAPPLQPASPSPTPRPMAQVGVPFPLATPPRGPKASPARPLSPYHSITPSLCHCQRRSPDRPPGTGSGVPATFLTFFPSTRTPRYPPSGTPPAQPPGLGLSGRAQLHLHAHCLRDSLFTSLLHGRNPCHCEDVRVVFVKYVAQLEFQPHSVIHPSML